MHERTIRESVINYTTLGNQLVRPAIEQAGAVGDATRREVGKIIQTEKIREFTTLGLVLGARYGESSILIPDGTSPPAEDAINYVPSAYPGCLAPHLWLADGSSLYDYFGSGFTLLVTEDATAGTEALASQAAEHGIPLKILAPHDHRLADIYQARFALIRPDQHVAWRGDHIPPMPVRC